MKSDQVSVEFARYEAGMRLVVTHGIPNPWSEAAKGLLHVKRIDHLRIPQHAGAANEDLVAWTGLNSSPIAIWNDETPRPGWSAIIALAERVAPFPPLIPASEQDRVLMFGMLHELCDEDGFAWNRRLFHFNSLPDLPHIRDDEALSRMRGKYGHGGDQAHCRERMIAVLKFLGKRLREQEAVQQHFYFDTLSAIDIYSACFMAMVRPLPITQCPTSPELHAGYGLKDEEILAAVDPLLLTHRDMMYERWLELPMRL